LKIDENNKTTKRQTDMSTFHLTFNKESDGAWYIEFPGYPFSHHNLMMVAGADKLCDYVARMEGHPEKAVVDVTLGNNRLEGKSPVITIERFEKGYGVSYNCFDSEHKTPSIEFGGLSSDIRTAWLCPVTLLVLHNYPKKINLFIPEGESVN